MHADSQRAVCFTCVPVGVVVLLGGHSPESSARGKLVPWNARRHTHTLPGCCWVRTSKVFTPEFWRGDESMTPSYSLPTVGGEGSPDHGGRVTKPLLLTACLVTGIGGKRWQPPFCSCCGRPRCPSLGTEVESQTSESSQAACSTQISFSVRAEPDFPTLSALTQLIFEL